MIPRSLRTSVAAVQNISAASHRSSAAVISKPEISTAAKSGGGKCTLEKRLTCKGQNAINTIRKWKEEGRSVRKFELIRSIRLLRSRKRYKNALQVFKWLTTQDDIELVSGDYALHLDLIGKVQGMNKAEKFFKDLPDKMKDHTTFTALLHTYVLNKDLDKSEALMTKMSECGFLQCPLPYNQLISLYISMGKLEKVPGMLQELLKNISPDIVTYNLWLSFCATQDDIETAEKIIRSLKRKKIHPDWVTHSTLAKIYLKSSLKDKAVVSLMEMEEAISENDRSAYSSLISLHSQLENKDEVVRIWKKLKSRFKKANDAEYNCMISSLLKLGEFEQAEKMYAEWEYVSPTRDARISNLLLAAYINNNLLDKAEKFHKQMIEKGIPPGYTTWELLTWGYLKQKQVDKTLDCFKKMVGSVKRWDPDEKMIRELVELIEDHGNTDSAEELLATLRRTGETT